MNNSPAAFPSSLNRVRYRAALHPVLPRKITDRVAAGIIAAAAVTTVISGNSTFAATAVWVGNTSANWSNGANWTGGTGTGGVPASGEGLTFNVAGTGGSSLTDDLMTPGTYTVAGITFNATASAYTINPATAGTNGFTLSTNVVNNSANLQTINDLITLGVAIQFNSGTGGLTLGGAVSGANALTAVGSSTVTLSGADSYSGTTTVGTSTGTSAETLLLNGTLSGTTSITVDVGATFTESGTGSYTNTATTAALTISGTATLSGINTFGGGTTVGNFGPVASLTLDFSHASAPTTANNILASGNAVTLEHGTLAIIGGGAGASNSQTLGSVFLGADTANTITTNLNGGTALSLNLGTIGTSTTRLAQSTVDITFSTGTGSVTGTGTQTNGILTDANGVAFATANGGATWVGKSGTTLTPLAASGYSSTYAAANNVDVTNGDNQTGVTVNTLRFNGANALTLAGTNTINTGGLLVTGSGTGSSIVSTSGTIRGGTGKEVVIHDYGSINIGASIVDSASGASSLTHTGTGTTTLSAASNTYTGITSNDGGTLIVTGSLTSPQILVDAGSLMLQGSDTAATGTTSTTSTTISGGSLALYQSNSAGTSNIKFAAGTGTTATLNLRSDSNTTFTNTLSTGVAGSVINVDQATSAGGTGHTLTIGAFATNQAFTVTNGDGYNLNIGALTSPNSAPTVTNNMSNGALTLASFALSGQTSTLKFAGTSTTASTAVTGSLTQTGSFVLSVSQGGVGNVTFNAASAYTGTTAVTAGTLTLNATGAASATSGITVTSSTLALTASNALATPATVTAAGTVTGQVPIALAGGTLLRNGGSVSLGSQSGGTGTVGIGILTLTSSSTIDFGTTGVGTLNFAGLATTGTPLSATNKLSIIDYSTTHPSAIGTDGTDDRIIFDQNVSAYLPYITIDGTTPTEDTLGNGEYELVATVPEPSTMCSGALLLAFVGWTQFRRVRRNGRLPFAA